MKCNQKVVHDLLYVILSSGGDKPQQNMCSRSNWKRFLVGQNDTLNRGLYVSPYVIARGLFVIADTVAGYFMSHHAYLARGLYVSGTLCHVYDIHIGFI